MKTADLIGPALDWAVAKAEGITEINNGYGTLPILDMVAAYQYSPSTDWSQGGPILEREKIDIIYDIENEMDNDPVGWLAQKWVLPLADGNFSQIFGTTPLIAAMRCYVASKLGDEIELPEELR